MRPLAISALGARRFLVRRHLLAPARSQTAGLDGVRAVFERLGSIQFDPLAVAGRNHDLVLHARVRDYEIGWTNELLYGTRELFETYNKMLSLVPSSELPWHRHTWARFKRIHQDEAFVRHGEAMEHVLERIRAEGPLTSLDFGHRGKVSWYWGPTTEVRAILEALWEAGVVSLDRREGNRRYFDLTERVFPPELLADERPEREQLRHKLLSRYRAHGLLGAGGESALWYGLGPAVKLRAKDPPGTPTRTELRAELLAEGDLLPVEVEGVRGPRYVLAGEADELRAADGG
ncbi:MAG: crosslink repair DNA glycosylase YcaQ family protein, partial [Candidatus Limnocylindrales bacterium]